MPVLSGQVSSLATKMHQQLAVTQSEYQSMTLSIQRPYLQTKVKNYYRIDSIFVQSTVYCVDHENQLKEKYF